MTMLRNVDNDRLLPSKQEIANHCAEDDCKTKPRVVSHEDQHQHQRQRNLYQMKHALIEMHHRKHCRSEMEQATGISLQFDDSAHGKLIGQVLCSLLKKRKVHALLVALICANIETIHLRISVHDFADHTIIEEEASQKRLTRESFVKVKRRFVNCCKRSSKFLKQVFKTKQVESFLYNIFCFASQIMKVCNKRNL